MSRFGWAYVNDVITGSGGGTPGGSDKQIQFNSGSTFSGSTNLTFNYTTNNVSLTGALLMSGTSYISEVDYIDFDVSASIPSFKQGRLFYDTNFNDLSYYTPVTDVQVNLGQQTVARVKNMTGGTISKGKLVHIVGGTGDTPLINTASWDNDANSANTLGMVMKDISHDNFGFIMLNGVITNVNTDPATFTVGQVIYLSSSGNYTPTAPVAPKHTVRLGEVIRAHATVGSIFIKVDNGYELDELHNVLITGNSEGDLLSYNNSTGLWVNSKILSGSYEVSGTLTVKGLVSSSIGVQTAGAITSQSIVSSSLGFQTNSTITAANNITSTSGLVSASNGLYSGDVLNVAGVSNLKNNLIVTGNVNVSGTLVSTSTIQAAGFIGDGLNITGIEGSNVYGVGDDWTVQFKDGLNGTLTGSANLTFNSNVLSSSAISASSYVGPIPKHAVFAANGVSTGTNYEVITVNGNKYLQLQKRRTFPIARSIGASDSEYGWTWLNRTSISGSSTENTTVVSGANFVHAQAQTTWFSTTTHTAPVRYKTYPLGAGESIQVVARIAATGSANYEQVQILIWTSGSNGNYFRTGVGYDLFSAGPRVLTQHTTNQNILISISASQMLDGVWFAVNLTEDNFSSYYNFSTSSTPPTSGWQYNTGSSFILSPNYGRPLNIGQMIMTDHANPQTVTGSFKYFDVNITRNELAGFVNTSQYVQWPATQFDTSGTEQLIGEYDLGSSATVNQTILRQLLADLENNQYLENATITWSAVQSNSSGASSGTFYSSSSVVVSGSGRYFRLWVKITSNGNQAGSIGPFPIVIPIS